jgi:hypothetical protein
MTNAKSLDDDYFIKNAIMCWLHYFGDDHKWSPIYKELAKRDSYSQQTRRTRAKKTNTEGV